MTCTASESVGMYSLCVDVGVCLCNSMKWGLTSSLPLGVFFVPLSCLIRPGRNKARTDYGSPKITKYVLEYLCVHMLNQSQVPLPERQIVIFYDLLKPFHDSLDTSFCPQLCIYIVN